MARARSFGSIRKLPSGKHQARYWHLGKQISAEHAYVNRIDARRWLSTVEVDLVRDDWVDPDAGKVTFGEYASWWIGQRPVRPRTKQIYEGQLKHVTPTFAAVSLCDIRPVDVRGRNTWADIAHIRSRLRRDSAEHYRAGDRLDQRCAVTANSAAQISSSSSSRSPVRTIQIRCATAWGAGSTRP